MEWFLIDCCKVKNKVILVSDKGYRLFDELIKI